MIKLVRYQKNRFLFFLILISSITSITSYAGTWEKSNIGSWKYLKDDGHYAKNEWIVDNNNEYYFDDEYMLQDRMAPDGKWMGIDGTWIGKDWSWTDHTDLKSYVKDVPVDKEWKLYGDWKNELVAFKIGDKIKQKIGYNPFWFTHRDQKTYFWDGRIITDTIITAEFKSISVPQLLDYTLWKTETDDGYTYYQLDIKSRIDNPARQLAVEALCLLISDDKTLYDVIYNSFEGDNKLYNINYDNYVNVGNFQIIADLDQSKECMRYLIKDYN